jgi:integrase
MKLKLKLTDKAVAQLKAPSEGEQTAWDTEIPGFGYRMRSGGSASWVFKSGRNPLITIGKASAMGAPPAREIARDNYLRVAKGETPWTDKREANARAAETFKSCLDVYLARRRSDPRLRASSLREIERHLAINLCGLHSTPIHELDRRSIAIETGKLTNSAPVQANRALASLRRFLSWCAGEGYIDANPAQFVNKNAEASRSRVLSDSELKAIWLGLPSGDFADIIRVLVLTACRANEVAQLKWGEIDFDIGVIALPGTRTKNGRSHIIPMSATVRAILQARSRRDNRDAVFGRGQRGFSGWSQAKKRLDADLKIPPWRVHDLRRSAATGMANIGVEPFVVERILNHSSGKKIEFIYNKSRYANETAIALARWDQHLADVIADRVPKVSSLPKRA